MKQLPIAIATAIICSADPLGSVGYAEDKPIKKDLKLAFVPKNINNPYNVIETGGSIDASKEMGAKARWLVLRIRLLRRRSRISTR